MVIHMFGGPKQSGLLGGKRSIKQRLQIAFMELAIVEGQVVIWRYICRVFLQCVIREQQRPK